MTREAALRPVRPADAPNIARHRYPDPHHPEGVQAYAAWVAGAIERGTYLGWFALGGEQVIAGAGVVLLEWGPTRHSTSPYRARITNVYTDPAWRRQGHARRLVQRCVSAARARGVTQLNLSATDASRALYARLGFRGAEHEMTLEI